MANRGAWGIGNFRLPDFGLTERAAGLFSGGRTTDLSNAITGNYSRAQSPSVLGTSNDAYAGTQSPIMSSPINYPTSGGGVGRNIAPVQQPQQQPQQQQQDPFAQLKGEISSGWDQYISGLDEQLGTLGTQKTAQENIVGEQSKQALGQLGLQKEQGLQELQGQRGKTESNQAKNLRDLAANVSNAMRAGNIYLGARGASDSSAANQYSYALGKEATRERSNVMQNTADIMNEIAGRETNLNNIYNTETNRIESEKSTNLNSIAQWYASAVQTIQQQKAQGQLGKSQDLANLSKDALNRALSALDQVNQYVMGKRQALDQWAMNNADSIAEVKANLQQVSAFSPQLPTAGPIAGTPQVSGGNMFTPTYGGGFGEEEDRGLFG